MTAKQIIPKVIHYCWFGKNAKPELVEKCIKSWEKKCPDYQIKEWNEDNFAIDDCPLYVRQAYEIKKWAFVSDYARLKIIYDNGGIYLDTDVQLIKRLDKLLSYNAFFALENANQVATGLGFGARKGEKILLDLMNDYNDIKFVDKGKMDLIPCPQRNLHVFTDYGFNSGDVFQLLNGNIAILPTIYMCPIDYSTLTRKYSLKTISIHWFAASWKTEHEKQIHKRYVRKQKTDKLIDSIVHLPNRVLRIVLGDKRYDSVKNLLKNKS